MQNLAGSSQLIEIQKIGYGLRNEQLVYISEVERGLACGCVCVKCKQPLVAKKGAIRLHHFAHAVEIDCKGAAETALHLLSKELFKEINSMVLPPYVFEKKRKTKYGEIHHKQFIANGGTASFTDAYIERKERGFIPDILLVCGGKTLIVEIAVTHKVDKEKLRRIRRSDLPAIEIQLNRDDIFLPRDELRRKLQQDLECKSWLFHPGQRKAEVAYVLMCRQYVKNKRKDLAAALAAETKSKKYSAKSPSPTAKFDLAKVNSKVLAEVDRKVFEFYVAYKRQPTLEEYRRLWPRLWEKT